MPLICTLGDAVLDVVARLRAPLAPDDDTPAETTLRVGGQAANVAAWVAALGGRARCVARHAEDATGALVARELAALDVELVGPVGAGRTGVVVSLVGPGGGRTMVSDRGVSTGFESDELDPDWFAGAVWLHLSGYAIATESDVTEHAAELARPARVSVDLSSWTVVRDFGPDRLLERLRRIAPDVVFATEPERAALGGELATRWIVKRGAHGIEVDGVQHPALPATVVDTTGAGDALAAGFLLGGVALGLEAAARCVATVGAVPRADLDDPSARVGRP